MCMGRSHGFSSHSRILCLSKNPQDYFLTRPSFSAKVSIFLKTTPEKSLLHVSLPVIPYRNSLQELQSCPVAGGQLSLDNSQDGPVDDGSNHGIGFYTNITGVKCPCLGLLRQHKQANRNSYQISLFITHKIEEILRNIPSPSSFLGTVCPQKGSETSNNSISLAQMDQSRFQSPASHQAVTGTSP